MGITHLTTLEAAKLQSAPVAAYITHVTAGAGCGRHVNVWSSAVWLLIILLLLIVIGVVYWVLWQRCQVTGAHLVDQSTVQIDLQSTDIALFVWLDVPGYPGRFSDNGFIMVRPDISVTFHSWTNIDNLQRFTARLTVRSLADVYT